MKIRKGFVSNSSSSCFICGMGWKISKKDNEYSIKQTADILQKILDFYNDLYELNESFETVFDTPTIATEKDFELLEGFSMCHAKQEDIIGKILIYSKKDNSIPYGLFGLIEDKFNAYRVHLG